MILGQDIWIICLALLLINHQAINYLINTKSLYMILSCGYLTEVNIYLKNQRYQKLLQLKHLSLCHLMHFIVCSKLIIFNNYNGRLRF